MRVYDMEDRFLTEAPQSKLTAGYLATQEQIAELMAAKRKAEKAVREYGQALRLPDDPERALNLATALARHNLDELALAPNPKCIELRRAEQEEPLLRAVGRYRYWKHERLPDQTARRFRRWRRSMMSP